jgi:arylsulfatase A-like enzyme/Flp pilus assembly protein TadD
MPLLRVPNVKPNVLLITIDTLRADRVGAYGAAIPTPAMDSLARHGVLFENAFSQVPITLPSHATILTGVYPYTHGIKHNGKFRLLPEATSIAEILWENGYHTAAFIGSYVLDAKYGLSQGFEHYDDEMPGETYPGTDVFMDRRAEDITDRALSWLTEAREPFFLWLHYYDPHKPYNPPPLFKSLSPEPYDGEVAYVDAEIGRFLEGLSGKGLSGNTFIILTSDHGESLGEHGELTHSIFLYRATTWVPLILTFPAKLPSGLRDSTMVRLVDIVPTVLAVLSLEKPPECEGRNLLAHGAGPLEEYAYAETWAPRLQYGWSEIRSLRDDRHLYIMAPKPELYDVSRDPGEITNVIGERPQEAQRFAALLDSILEGARGKDTLGAEMELGREERERLESLGYVFRPGASPEGGEDPKDMIPVHRQILEARKILLDGDYAGSLSILEKVRARDEGDPAVHLFLGLAHEGLGQDSLALASFTRSIDLDPLEERSYYSASRLLTRIGKNGEAVKILEDLVEHYPHDPTARLTLAKAYARAGDTDRAALAYGETIDLEKDDYRIYVDFGRFLAVRGRFDEAIDMLGRALELNPDSPEALALLGASHAREGELEEARKNFLRALTKDSTMKAVWVDLANIQKKLGREGEAEESLRRALALDAGYLPARKLLEPEGSSGGEE